MAKPITPPVYYLITPEPQPPLDEFLAQLQRALLYGVRLLQLRSKALSLPAFLYVAARVLPLAHAFDAKVIFNGPRYDGNHFNPDGLHLTSQALACTQQRPVAQDKWFSAACHDAEQIARANQVGADFITLSPVCATASSPQKSALGWQAFARLAALSACPVYALGGLSVDNLAIARKHGAYGIAAQRALWQLRQPLV